MFNNSRPREKIISEYGTIRAFASALGLSDRTVSSRLCNKSQWRLGEIIKTVDLLRIAPADIGLYFFTVSGSASNTTVSS